MTAHNHWIGVVSRSHVEIGVKGGFIQLNHGKKAPLQKFRAGDGLVMYSPRTSYPDGKPLQSFTAIGTIAKKTERQRRRATPARTHPNNFAKRAASRRLPRTFSRRVEKARALFTPSFFAKRSPG